MADDEDAYVESRLGKAIVVWLTTVRPDGQPQTSPVWFAWDDETFLVYSMPRSAKVPNVRANPNVALNLNHDGVGGDIVTIEGTARFDEDAPPVHQHASYVEKYRAEIERLGMEPEPFAAEYSTAIRITPTRVRLY